MAGILRDAWGARLRTPAFRDEPSIALLVNFPRSRHAGIRRLERDVKASMDTAANHHPVPGRRSEGGAKGTLLPEPGQAEHTPGADRQPGPGLVLRDAKRPVPPCCQ